MSVLFEETGIRSMGLKNRLVRSATHEGMADERGFPTENHFNLYERLARGGIGLIVTGFAFVSPDGNSFLPGMNGMDTDDHVPRWREVADRVHGLGARIAMQIAHCGRQTTEKAIGARPIAPSAVKDKSIFETPRAMNEEDIERVIEAFGQAARRVKEAGFDAVQLHGAHGFLLNNFLSPHTNRRTDRWGGSVENRMRIIGEVYRHCRRLIGDDYPLLLKINADDHMKNGLKLEESLVMAGMMADMGFDGIEVSCGISEDGGSTIRGDMPVDVVLDEWDMYKNKGPVFRFIMRRWGAKIQPPVPFSEGYNLDGARAVKGRVNVPVFSVGGMVDPAAMERAVEKGHADYISLSRPLVADPSFPQRIREGSRDHSVCVRCNLCLFSLMSRPLRCYRGKRMKKTND